MRIFTIGHSTRTLEEFRTVLRHYQIEALADIRHFPRSRHNPQFNREVLAAELPRDGVEYLWLEKLGGFRYGGYLAYIETADFVAGIEQLEKLSRQKLTAYMCAKLVWFRCHRRHVSDVLAARGWSVTHVFDEKRSQEHIRKTNKIKCD